MNSRTAGASGPGRSIFPTARCVFRDLTDGGELTATQINLKTTDIESGEPFEIHLAAAVNGCQTQLATREPDRRRSQGHRDFRDVPLAGEINATDLDLGKVNKALPQFRKALPRALRFDGIYTIKELKFAGTLNNLSFKGAVTGNRRILPLRMIRSDLS